MRHITNNNIVIEFTKDEIRDLIMYCFDASRWNEEHGYPTLGHNAHLAGMKLWDTIQELDK